MTMLGLSEEMMNLFYMMGLGGMLTSLLYYVYGLAYEYVQRSLITSVQIENMDPVYKWLLQFLTEKGYLADQMTDSVVRVVKKKKEWWQPKSKEKPKVEYYPAPGLHYFRYKNRKMWAVQQAGKVDLVGWENKPLVQESIVIMCYGGSTALIRELIDEAVLFSLDTDKGLLGIYQVVGWLGAWAKTMTKKARSVDSVVLDEDIAETLAQDVRTFQ
jgi:chaperone BCS1